MELPQAHNTPSPLLPHVPLDKWTGLQSGVDI